MRHSVLTTLALTLALACDHEAPDVDEADADLAAPVAGAPKTLDKHHAQPASEKYLGDAQAMPDAEAAFAETLKLIDHDYVDAKVDRDALFTGATEGLLARLYQVGDHPVNTLLSPRDLEELTSGTAGAIVGVGVAIEHVAGVVVVRDVIAGGPAAAAGLLAGDRILAIDDVRVHDLTIAQVVDRIRGAAGTKVDLFVQRDTEEWHAALTRATVAIQNVEAPGLDGDVGYLKLRGFAETTPAELDAAIVDLRNKGMRSLILDLRECPGGLLDAAVAVAGRFLADGQPIGGLASRGGEDKPLRAVGDGQFVKGLPLAVLIGPHTSSGAEILADALKHSERATLIGAPTLGKDTVEHIHKLSNGWGLKLSGSRLLAASGEPRLGKGITPTLPVPVAKDDDHGPEDAALSVARAWLRERPR